MEKLSVRAYRRAKVKIVSLLVVFTLKGGSLRLLNLKS